ncbi:MAG: DUF3987 domain-containing protein [Candidatus Contendobacter sp.]
MDYTIQDVAGALSLPEALAQVNLSPPESPPLDGSWFRYTDPQHPKANNKAAYIRAFLLPESGVITATFGSWWREAQGLGGPWQWQSVPPDSLTREQRERLEAERTTVDSEYREARAKRQQEAAENAARMWQAATPVHGADHPYLAKKGVPGLGAVRLLQSTLLVPLFDVKPGALCSLVRILPTGEKYNLEGAKKAGCAGPIGPEPTAGGRVWLCEGIATGLSLHLATGDPVYSCGDAGNLAPVALALHERLSTARIWIGGDNDPAGRQGAQKALQAVYGARAVFPEIPAGKGTDWNDLHAAAGLEAVKTQLQAAATAPVEPEPLRREPPPPEPFPLEALGPLLTPAALALRRIIQAPDALIAQSLLAAAALCVQPHANVIIDGRVSPLALFCITVGASGERKTAVDVLALKPITDRQRELVALYRNDDRLHKTELREFERIERETLKEKVVDLAALKANRDRKKSALDALGEPPQAPLLPNLLAADPTAEGLFKLFANGQPSLGLFSDEGALFIGGAAMMKETRLRTIGALSKLWDGRPLDRVRSGDGASVLFDRRLSLHLMMQPLVAAELFGDPIFHDQGFLSRVLCAWPDSTAGTRRYRSEDASQDPAIGHYWSVLKALLERPYPLREGTRNELTPRNLPLSDPAKAVWIRYSDTIETQLGDGQPLEPIRGFANKAAEHAARIAGVLAVIETPNAGVIDVPHVQAAIALMDYYLTEMVRIQETGAGNPDILLAERLLEWARGHEVIHPRLICQYGPNAIREAETAKRLCRLLETHGWLAKVEGGAVLEGVHRRNVWRVCR